MKDDCNLQLLYGSFSKTEHLNMISVRVAVCMKVFMGSNQYDCYIFRAGRSLISPIFFRQHIKKQDCVENMDQMYSRPAASCSVTLTFSKRHLRSFLPLFITSVETAETHSPFNVTPSKQRVAGGSRKHEESPRQRD